MNTEDFCCFFLLAIAFITMSQLAFHTVQMRCWSKFSTNVTGNTYLNFILKNVGGGEGDSLEMSLT